MRLYASTLDKADVKIMQELAANKYLPLLQNHIFQFDFLNDSLFDTPCERHKDKLDPACKDCQESKPPPKSLQEILKDETKHRKLIIFINPPYAEAGNIRQTSGTGVNKPKVATDNVIYQVLTGKGKVEGIQIESKDYLGKASNELFAQFFMRIYQEIPHCKLATFSKLKYLNASNFVKFRETFKAKFLTGFMCPADTFDNVKGAFP